MQQPAGVAGAVLLEAHQPQIAQGFGVIRAQLQGAHQVRLCCIGCVIFHQHGTQVGKRLQVIRVDGQRLVVPVGRRLQILARPGNAAQVVERLQRMRCQRQRLLVASLRFVIAPGVIKGNAQIAVCGRHGCIQRNRPLAVANGIFQSALLTVHLGQVAVKQRHRRLQHHCLPNQLQRHVRSAGLVGHHAQQMQRMRMLRL